MDIAPAYRQHHDYSLNQAFLCCHASLLLYIYMHGLNFVASYIIKWLFNIIFNSWIVFFSIVFILDNYFFSLRIG